MMEVELLAPLVGFLEATNFIFGWFLRGFRKCKAFLKEENYLLYHRLLKTLQTNLLLTIDFQKLSLMKCYLNSMSFVLECCNRLCKVGIALSESQ